jgi:hypothetical protein
MGKLARIFYRLGEAVSKSRADGAREVSLFRNTKGAPLRERPSFIR